jgi:hypothetical protein
MLLHMVCKCFGLDYPGLTYLRLVSHPEDPGEFLAWSKDSSAKKIVALNRILKINFLRFMKMLIKDRGFSVTPFASTIGP